jgi:hypothetical protein
VIKNISKLKPFIKTALNNAHGMSVVFFCPGCSGMQTLHLTHAQLNRPSLIYCTGSGCSASGTRTLIKTLGPNIDEAEINVQTGLKGQDDSILDYLMSVNSHLPGLLNALPANDNRLAAAA